MSHPVNAPTKGYLATKGVGLKFGGVSTKTIIDWGKKGILPKPDLTILGHNYWLEENLDAHMHKRMIEGVERRPVGQFDASEANPRGGKRLVAKAPDKRPTVEKQDKRHRKKRVLTAAE
jgi:hypothetical protein